MNEINQVVHTPLPGQLIANYHDDEERTQRKRFQYRRKKKWFAQLIFFPFRKENPYTCLWKKKWTKKFFFLSRSHLIITEEQLPLPCPWNKRKCGEKNSVDRGVLSGPEKAPKKIKIKMEDGHFFSSLSLFFLTVPFSPHFVHEEITGGQVKRAGRRGPTVSLFPCSSPPIWSKGKRGKKKWPK